MFTGVLLQNNILVNNCSRVLVVNSNHPLPLNTTSCCLSIPVLKLSFSSFLPTCTDDKYFFLFYKYYNFYTTVVVTQSFFKRKRTTLPVFFLSSFKLVYTLLILNAQQQLLPCFCKSSGDNLHSVLPLKKKKLQSRPETRHQA